MELSMRVKEMNVVTEGMGSLHEKIAQGEYSIEVKETAIGKLATLNKGGERTLSQKEHDELEELLENYEEIIIDLWEANHQDDDPHMSRWRLGKVLQEDVEDDEKRDMDMLIPMLPFTDSKSYRYRHYHQKFYKTFQDKDWNEKESAGTLSDLASRAESPQEAREIYDERMRDVDESFTRDEIRAWSDAQEETDEPNLAIIAEKAVDRFSRSPSPKNIENIYRLFGSEDFPSDDEIESAVQANSE